MMIVPKSGTGHEPHKKPGFNPILQFMKTASKRGSKTFDYIEKMNDLKAAVPQFSNFPFQQRKTIADQFVRMDFDKGAKLIEEGTPIKYAYIIQNGEVKVTQRKHKNNFTKHKNSHEFSGSPMRGNQPTTKQKLQGRCGYQNKTFQELEVVHRSIHQWVGYESILQLNEACGNTNFNPNLSEGSVNSDEQLKGPLNKLSAQVVSQKATVYRINVNHLFNQNAFIRQAFINAALQSQNRIVKQTKKVEKIATEVQKIGQQQSSWLEKKERYNYQVEQVQRNKKLPQFIPLLTMDRDWMEKQVINKKRAESTLTSAHRSLKENENKINVNQSYVNMTPNQINSNIKIQNMHNRFQSETDPNLNNFLDQSISFRGNQNTLNLSQTSINNQSKYIKQDPRMSQQNNKILLVDDSLITFEQSPQNLNHAPLFIQNHVRQIQTPSVQVKNLIMRNKLNKLGPKTKILGDPYYFPSKRTVLQPQATSPSISTKPMTRQSLDFMSRSRDKWQQGIEKEKRGIIEQGAFIDHTKDRSDFYYRATRTGTGFFHNSHALKPVSRASAIYSTINSIDSPQPSYQEVLTRGATPNIIYKSGPQGQVSRDGCITRGCCYRMRDFAMHTHK